MSAKSATVNHTLTNYASGVAADSASALARFLCPLVPTGGAFGQYKRYSDKNAFQVHDTSRAIGGDRKRINFEADDPYYNCQPQGLEIPVDDHELDRAGETADRMVRARTRTLVLSSLLSHEHKVFTAARAGVSATAGVGEWSNAAKDPLDELDSQIAAISDATGIIPNRMVLGLVAYRVLKNHPLVLKRLTGSANANATLEVLASLLINPAIEIRLGLLSRDTTKFGVGKSASNLVGAEAFIFCGTDNADEYDPSFMKCFSTTGGLVESVRQYRADRAASDVYYMDWSEDIKVTSSACARRITLS